MPFPPYHVHPMVVHFPIALLSAAASFEVLAATFFRAEHERWQWAAAGMLWAGTLFAALAIASGLWAESTAPAIPSAYDTVLWHKGLGISVGVLSAVLSLWRFMRRPPAMPCPMILYVLLWLALVTVLGITGLYGGRLVYDFAVGVEGFTSAV